MGISGSTVAVTAELPGDTEVLRALLHRRRAGSRDDGNRIALVVNGGGMRGAYAGGMVHALEEAGLSDTFDVVYGSSAGAFVAIGLLLGNGRGAAHIFFEDMASRSFIDPRRMGSKRPMVSLDHLMDHILVASKPLPWDELRDCPIPVKVVATAADDLSAHVLQPRTIQEWQLAMRATSTIPVLAGPPVRLAGRDWIDGSVAEPLPVLRALADGATHVLALVNRTVPDLRRPNPVGRQARWARSLDRLAPGLGSMAQESHRLRPEMAVLDSAQHPSRSGAHLYAVTPVVDAGVRGLTTDPVRVRAAADSGFAAMNAVLYRAGGGVPADGQPRDPAAISTSMPSRILASPNS